MVTEIERAADRTLARLLAADFVIDLSNATIPAPPHDAESLAMAEQEWELAEWDRDHAEPNA
jgi:hypothetical protein